MKMRSEEPNKEARQAMMSYARYGNERDNSFFIDRETGKLISSSWRDDKSYYPTIPQDTYEVHIQRSRFMSYSDLQELIDSIMQRVWEEDEMSEQQEKDMKELSTYSDDCLKEIFGFSEQKIKELREMF
jgi:hypothetical protein